MFNIKCVTCLALSFLFLLSGCTWVSKHYGKQPYEDSPYEIEQMALLLGGELRAPQEVIDLVHSDMLLIREHIKNTKFWDRRFEPRWVPGCIELTVDYETGVRVRAGTYDDWSALHEEVRPYEIEQDFDEYRVTVWFGDDINVWALGERYMQLPGIQSAEACKPPPEKVTRTKEVRPPVPGDGGNIFMRRTLGGVEYIFYYWYTPNIYASSTAKRKEEYLHVFFHEGKVKSNLIYPGLFNPKGWL